MDCGTNTRVNLSFLWVPILFFAINIQYLVVYNKIQAVFYNYVGTTWCCIILNPVIYKQQFGLVLHGFMLPSGLKVMNGTAKQLRIET